MLPLVHFHSPILASSTKLPIALFGAGGYGAYHLEILSSLQESGLVDLKAVVDPALSHMPDLRASLEKKGISWYEKSEGLFETEHDLKAISIAAPVPWHENLCRTALRNDLFVYLEKPPVPLIQQFNSLVRLDSPRKIAVAFQNIASSPIRTLKKWILEGRLGSIKTIRIAAGWPRDAAYYARNNWAGKLLLGDLPVFDGPATNGLAHVLHDAMFLSSPEPQSFALPLEITAELYRARPLESYDTCCIRAVLEDRIELTAALTHACKELFPYKILVTGSKGKAWISEDGKVLGNDQNGEGVQESTAEYRSRCCENFVHYALGHYARPDTFLNDTRGYVLLTNGMLLSSQNIHPIAEPYVSISGVGPRQTYAICGIHSLLQSTLETGRLFSELGAAWAVEGRLQLVRDLSELSLKPYLSFQNLSS